MIFFLLTMTCFRCFGLNMLATLPLEVFVCRSVMTTFYFPDEPYNPNRHIIFTTALVVTSVVLSLMTCDLGSVLELIGATSASVLAYILPPLCYIKLSRQSWKSQIPAYLCIAFGTTVLCISVIQVVVQTVKSKPLSFSLFPNIPSIKATNNEFSSCKQMKAELRHVKISFLSYCIIIPSFLAVVPMHPRPVSFSI